ncbi:DUF5606 domain-containing protein [Kordia algicida OT-1]|uniref:Uncharacterized protein n=1 Tax=Kordia algicida OT-1 TaxID=391587 RepID=A9EB00_9FLAO|nr:DUF5606 domain-containing protein [Kordia algicida]EDP94558.1 hypothetical protein KAOT1_10361 [Kordia algicida OT-1]
MSLEKILAISGKPGLYELKTQTRNGFVAESLSDGKKISVSLRHNVSLLSEIAIYTYSEEIPLAEVLEKVKEKENGAATSVNHKESKAVLTDYFSEVLPDYDQDRVYPSDIKKVIQWYNLLHSKGMTDFTAEASSEEE